MNSASAPTATTTNGSAPTTSGSPATEKNFTPLVRQFLDYLHLERHFSDYTVKSYGADLIQFGQFLMAQIGNSETIRAMPGDMTCDDRAIKCEPLIVREFLAYLYAQNYTKSTTARKLATLRSFYKFLIRRGMVSVNPLSTIRTPKQEKRLPKCLDLEQVQKLLDAPGDGDLLSARDKAMLEVLYSSGIRVSELVELEMQDLDLQEGVLRVKGKGRKDRLRIARPGHAQPAIDPCHARVPQQAWRAAEHALGAPQARQVPRAGGPRSGHQPAHAAPQLRDAPVEQRRRPAERAGAAGASIAQHDTDLHAPDDE
jgi:integrase/recombinase XerC